MSQQGKSLAKLGYIFGLGAFRRYEQHFDSTMPKHFDVVFRLNEELCEQLVAEGKLDKDVADMLPKRTISDVEANYRWAAMLKFANDLFIEDNGGDPLTIDQMADMISAVDQSEFNVVYERFLESYYMGKKMRVYYGIPEPAPEKSKPKKKASPSARQSPRRTKSATSGVK